MILAQVKQTYNQIPLGIRVFAKKALLLLVGWLILYTFLLQPYRMPDAWLTKTTAVFTVKVLNKFYQPGFTTIPHVNMAEDEKVYGDAILLNEGRTALFLADNCNAFDLFALYIAFFICLPITFGRILFFSITGLAGIFLLNIARCYALTWLTLNKPSWVDIAHHYVFTLIVYSFIFGAWVLYAKKYKAANA